MVYTSQFTLQKFYLVYNDQIEQIYVEMKINNGFMLHFF